MAGHHHHHSASGNIKVAFFLNLIFTIIEIIGGIFTNSMAILSDALHDLGDSLGLGLAWYLQTYSTKKRDQRYSYGYARFSLLSAFVNGVVLIIGSVFILSAAIPRLFNPVQPDADGMIILAILGIVFNGAAVLKTKGGHSHNEKMVSWHLLEDVLGWIAVLIGAIVMRFFGLPIIDAIISLVFTLFILYNVIRNVIKTARIFLQAQPEDVDLDEFEGAMTQLPNVNSAHDFHLWSMDGEKYVLTLHVVVSDQATPEEIKKIKKDIRNLGHKNKIDHITIEIEFESEQCELEDC
jgi:cobalt-zinc-cadmium efflux system protein